MICWCDVSIFQIIGVNHAHPVFTNLNLTPGGKNAGMPTSFDSFPALLNVYNHSSAVQVHNGSAYEWI